MPVPSPMNLFLVVLIMATFDIAKAAINGSCSANNVPGVCITTGSCSSGGGMSHSGFCPDDPKGIQCCTKTSCGTGGNCRFTSQCLTGNVASGLCPGPSDFKCCLPAAGGCTPPVANAATLSLIKEFEGFVASPEPDPTGLPTVAYGHLCETEGCAEVPYIFPMTEPQAATLLVSDLHAFESCISQYVADNIQLNDNQYGALVSWSYNVGCGNAQTSTLIQRLNAGEDPNTVAAEELPRWIYAGGQIFPGLVRRRDAEVVLFQTSSSVIAHPPC